MPLFSARLSFIREIWRSGVRSKLKKRNMTSHQRYNAEMFLMWRKYFIAAAFFGLVAAQRRWKWRDQHKGNTTEIYSQLSQLFSGFEVAGSNKLLKLVAILMQNWIKIICKYFCQVTEMTNGSKKHTSKWKAKVRKNRCHIVAEVKYRYRILVCCNSRFIIFRPNCPSSSWVLIEQPPTFFLWCSSPSMFATGQCTSSSCHYSSLIETGSEIFGQRKWTRKLFWFEMIGNEIAATVCKVNRNFLWVADPVSSKGCIIKQQHYTENNFEFHSL